jgi:hypothetical protein
MYYGATAGTAAGTGALAMTGDHLLAEFALALGLIFLGASFVRTSVRRRPHRP